MNIKTENFEKEVLNSTGLVLVDFWADWCQPCVKMAPALENLAIELSEKVKICKVNVEEESSCSEMFNIRNLPTLIMFKDGIEIQRSIGFMDKQKIKQTFNL